MGMAHKKLRDEPVDANILRAAQELGYACSWATLVRPATRQEQSEFVRGKDVFVSLPTGA